MSRGATGAAVAVAHRVDGPPGAPAVVLSGSLGTTQALWDPQADALGGRVRVVRYDHRGHGRSPVPDGPYSVEELGADLVALLDRLELERVSICGLSLGGAVAMWVASELPGRVDRLALCCTSASFGPPEDWHERTARVRAGGVAAIADAVIERWFTPAFRARRPDLVGELRTMLEATPAEGYASCCEAIATLDLRDGLGAIEAPTLVVAAADDPATPPAEAEATAAAVSRAQVAVLDRAAHLANVERPAEFGELLASHLGVGGPR